MHLGKPPVLFFLKALTVFAILSQQQLKRGIGISLVTVSYEADIMTMLTHRRCGALKALLCSKREKQIHFIFPVVHTTTLTSMVPTHV